MDQRAHKFVIDAAETDLRIGWGTGAVIVLLRAVVLAGFLAADAPVDLAALAWVVVQLVLAAAFTFGLYRGHAWAAVGLLVAWGVGYVYSWDALGRLLPPLGLIGVLVWYGLYRGRRGARALAAQRAAVAPAV